MKNVPTDTYFLHLGQERQVRIKCLVQGHGHRAGSIPTLWIWVKSMNWYTTVLPGKHLCNRESLFTYMYKQQLITELIEAIYLHSWRKNIILEKKKKCVVLRPMNSCNQNGDMKESLFFHLCLFNYSYKFGSWQNLTQTGDNLSQSSMMTLTCPSWKMLLLT